MVKKSAFTLIELLIVIVIIGVLATLAVPQYEKIVWSARGAEAKINARACMDSVWRYYLETGQRPLAESDIDYKPKDTKYIGYSFNILDAGAGSTWSSTVLLIAWLHRRPTPQPAGTVIGYSVEIDYRKPPREGVNGHKLDDTHYMYFGTLISDGAGRWDTVDGW